LPSLQTSELSSFIIRIPFFHPKTTEKRKKYDTFFRERRSRELTASNNTAKAANKMFAAFEKIDCSESGHGIGLLEKQALPCEHHAGKECRNLRKQGYDNACNEQRDPERPLRNKYFHRWHLGNGGAHKTEKSNWRHKKPCHKHHDSHYAEPNAVET